ncbi:MAG: hypothetical protein JOZ41_19755 [Chloroflexi bacterium]|nr:hypothetical protein [Chloroflexota bacterium]
MKPSVGLRYDFDPYGTAQVHVADMERRFAASALREQARLAGQAQRRAAGLENPGLWLRFARLVPGLRPAQ